MAQGTLNQIDVLLVFILLASMLSSLDFLKISSLWNQNSNMEVKRNALNIKLTLDWKKHKLESRLPGEISITSDMQMTPPYGRK